MSETIVTGVLLIDENGKKTSDITVEIAKQKAFDKGLDLVKVGGNGKLEVYKIIDNSKTAYEKKKKCKKNIHKTKMKEVRISTGIAENDLMTKIRQIDKFLSKGDHVKLSLRVNRRNPGGQQIITECIENALSKIEHNFKREGAISKNNTFCSIKISPSK